MDNVKGYKGFDENLKCRDFQYEIGKVYAIDKTDLKICKKGFHFCYDLNDIGDFYPFPTVESQDIFGINYKKNRYCEVEILGTVETADSKSVTDIIKIVRELTETEVIEIRNKKYWDAAWELQQKNPQFLIGGSMALMMVGLLPVNSRVFHDLDITAPHYVAITDDLEPTPNGRSRGVASHAIYHGVKVDFFIAPTEKPKRIIFNGKKWNITNISTILKAKVEYIFDGGPSEGNSKHKKDMEYIFGKKDKNPATMSSIDLATAVLQNQTKQF